MQPKKLYISDSDLPLNAEDLNHEVRAVSNVMLEYIVKDDVVGLKNYLSIYSPAEIKALVNIRGVTGVSSNPEGDVINSLTDAKSVGMCEYLISVGAELNAPDVNNGLIINMSFSLLKIDYLLSAGMVCSTNPTDMLRKCLNYACFPRSSPNADKELVVCEKLINIYIDKLSSEEIENKISNLLLILAIAPLNTRPPEQRGEEIEFVVKTMKKLLDKGAQINIIYSGGSGPFTILTKAIEKDSKEIFNFLVNYNPSLEQTQDFLHQIKVSYVPITPVKPYYKEYLNTQLEKFILSDSVETSATITPLKTFKV